jgi:lipopolysaccharide transport system ATP-binding protein
MSDIAIRVEQLSKHYRIGVAQQRHDTLRDQLTHGVKGLLRRNSRPRARSDTLWALKDVSVEVKKGEVIGIIGRNGAGKSTLLKILSRITHPTAGRAEIYGRVGSLLEVGTGFHGELTGRENVYLNGAILGMKKAEIDHKFDEIRRRRPPGIRNPADRRGARRRRCSLPRKVPGHHAKVRFQRQDRALRQP